MANVIIVEDNAFMREVLATLVRSLGHRVSEAGGAAEALGLLRGQTRFELAIIDIVLPGMSGIELARRIRAESAATAIVAVSGYVGDGSTDAVAALREIGVAEILRKPVAPVDFEAAIHNALLPHGRSPAD
jgi:CheY-like chemotaxis protein